MDDTGLRLRSIRMKPGYALDSLTNALTGLGTVMDPRTSNSYVARSLSQTDVIAAYRGSGLMRKIINIPPLDMVREAWDWKADDADITTIEAEERRHMIRQKVRQAEVLRGLGGGALILGLPGNPSQPAPDTIGKGQLAFVHVVSRWQLQFDATQDDSRLPGYGEPTMYRMETTVGQIDLHPTRVIPFRGEPIPVSIVSNFVEDFWGDSRVAAVLDAVQDSDTARGAFAHLISKARNVRVGIPNLLDTVADADGEAAFQRRMRAFATAESIFNATVYDSGNGTDGGEKIDDVTYNFAGIKDVMNAFGEWVSAISDIPATRLLGRAPEGMNSSGDSQQKDWGKKIRAMQTLEMAPCLDRLMHYVVRSALGAWPEGLWYDFAPLDNPTEKENAERFKAQADAIVAIQNTGTIPDQAFAEGVQSLMIDEGYLPALESALAKVPENERYGIEAEEIDNGGEEVVETSAGEGGSRLEADPPRRAANDAKPRTLYVSRKVKNVADLKAWAREQGLPALQDDLHVTIAYSRTPVDWIEMGSSWADYTGKGSGDLLITAGGPRVVEPLGDRTAVLMFASSDLSWRNREMREKGASWDWEDYQPHISLTGEPVDLASVEPYRGKIVLGPEIFEEIREEDA